MKKLIFLFPFLFAMFTACNYADNNNEKTQEMKQESNLMNSSADTTKAAESAAIVYTCPMHPEVQSDKPGKCPKCGMTLVVKQ